MRTPTIVRSLRSHLSGSPVTFTLCSQMNDVLLTALVSFASAGFGALAAFQLQNAKATREELDRRRMAVNRALFDLSQIWSTQYQYWKEAILPEKDSKAPWLHIQGNVSTQFQETRFNIDGLFFLADTDHAQYLPRLYTEQLRFQILIGMIEERSKLVLNVLHPKMEALGIGLGKTFDMAALERALGPDLTNKLKSLTVAIIEHTAENIESAEQLNMEFRPKMVDFFKQPRVFGLFGKKQLKVLEITYDK